MNGLGWAVYGIGFGVPMAIMIYRMNQQNNQRKEESERMKEVSRQLSGSVEEQQRFKERMGLKRKDGKVTINPKKKNN